MARKETVRNAELLVEKAMKGNDASHDSAHVWRVRDLALSLACEEGLSSSPESMEIVELSALLHDIGDYKYLRDPSEEKVVENFLVEEGVEENKKSKILKIITRMGLHPPCASLKYQHQPFRCDLVSSGASALSLMVVSRRSWQDMEIVNGFRNLGLCKMLTDLTQLVL